MKLKMADYGSSWLEPVEKADWNAFRHCVGDRMIYPGLEIDLWRALFAIHGIELVLPAQEEAE
jgi:hypothetical protein